MTTATNQKTLQLSWLEPGDRFEIPSISDTMRNLRVISTNESSTSVEGERRNGINDPWVAFRFPIANTVRVVLVEKNAPKITDFKKKDMNTEEQNTEITPPRRRGRPAKQSKPLNELGGTKGDFTVKDLVEKNGMKEYDAHNLVRSAIKQGTATVVREESGGRGKPRKVYRLV
jgi:hypothetical protein